MPESKRAQEALNRVAKRIDKEVPTLPYYHNRVILDIVKEEFVREGGQEKDFLKEDGEE